MSHARVLLVASVLLLGAVSCKKGPRGAVTEAELPSELMQFAVPPQTLTYERKRVVGQIGLPVAPVRESWTRVTSDVKGVHYEVTIGVEQEGANRVVRRFRYGADGLVLVAEGPIEDSGEVTWEPWVPPAVVLPPQPQSAGAWEDTHTVGDEEVSRSCEIMSSSEPCDGDGLVVVCDSTWPAFRLVTRDHFCRSVGWSGYESLVVQEGHPTVRTWTEGLRRLD